MVRYGAAQSTILDTCTLGDALARMIKHHRQQLLIVNEAGEFIGEITTFTLARLLLPDTEGRTQTREEVEQETIRDVDDRIAPHLGRRVSELAEHDLPVVHPDTPFSEAVKLLASGKLRLPVVDPETNKLVGVISPLTILRRYQF
jgi:CBS domain-containing protein